VRIPSIEILNKQYTISQVLLLFRYTLAYPPQVKRGGKFRTFIMVCVILYRDRGETDVTSRLRLSPHFLLIPVELDGCNLAGIIIILVAQNLPTRFLSSCLEAEIFKFKVNLVRPPYFFHIEFYCRKWVFVVCCAIELIN